jgi:hypothetical protein
MLNKTAFLIISCDTYSGLWETHFRCLDKQWPDCPFSKYLLTNHLDSGRPEIQAIKTGEDQGWSANLKKALDILRPDYEYVLVTFDDLLLIETVNNHLLNKVLESFFNLDGQFLQLIKWHNKPKRVNDLLGLIEPDSLYRPNCVYALWKIDILNQLLIPEETAWEFERNGSARSNRFDGFYVVLQDIFQYRNIVIRGKIVPKDARDFNLSHLPNLKVMSSANLLRFRLRYWSFKLFLLLVPRKRQVQMVKTKNKIIGVK